MNTSAARVARRAPAAWRARCAPTRRRRPARGTDSAQTSRLTASSLRPVSSALLEQIVAATAGEYDVVGALGETSRGAAFLAREAAGGRMVVLFVPTDAEALEVLAALSEDVPANAGRCTACGYAPMVWTAGCPSCQRPFVLAAVSAHRFTRDEVEAAVAHAYDVEGEVAHLVGGSLFFVRDRADGRLVALAGQVDAAGEQVLEAVWDGAQAALAGAPAASGASYGTPYAPAALEGAGHVGADPAAAYAGGHPADYGTDYGTTYTAPGYAPADSGAGYGMVDTPDAGRAAPRARRRWAPLAAAAALLAVTGGAWAFWQGDDDAPPAAVGAAGVSGESTAAGATAGEGGPAEGGAAEGAGASGTTAGAAAGTTAGAAAGAAGSGSSGATPDAGAPGTADGRSATTGAPGTARPSDPAAERRRTVDDSVRQARQAERALATLQLGTDPPAGWTWTIDGRDGPASPTVRLRPRREHVIRLDAPGYCPDVLRLTPEPGAAQVWTPRLRGKPMIGEC